MRNSASCLDIHSLVKRELGCSTISSSETTSEGQVGKKKVPRRLKRLLRAKKRLNREKITSVDFNKEGQLKTLSSTICLSGKGLLASDVRKCDIVAMDCEFVGIGPRKLSALGKWTDAGVFYIYLISMIRYI